MIQQKDLSEQRFEDLFPGFTAECVNTERGKFFIRRSPSNGIPILLLHGFPESHLCWSKIAASLGKNHFVVCLDLLGYGLSDAPAEDSSHERYSKREMAKDCLLVMDHLSIESFIVAGHDRGALVAMRLALLSKRIMKLIILDNLPTFVLWDRIAKDPKFIPHWQQIASPLGEKMLSQEWLEKLMRDETASNSMDAFLPTVLESYRQSWREPSHIHAFCEDYRAGAGPDVELDREDYFSGRIINVPSLVIWGAEFLGRFNESPKETWKRTFAPTIEGVEVPGGHFNPEESPTETLKAMEEFISTYTKLEPKKKDDNSRDVKNHLLL